jgi:DNA end-binding protein Ku
MAQHAAWKGHLKISLVSLPVQAFSVAEHTKSSDITFNQLHAACHNRIEYKKVCPVHGEVSNNEIVSGYEYEKGKYVVIDRDEKAAVELKGEKAIEIASFVPTTAIDPVYFAGQSYFLVPDGKVGLKTYAFIRKGLADEGFLGLGEIVLAKKQRLVAIRATGEMLMMDLLSYENEVRKPDDYAPHLPSTTAAAPELKLLKSLFEEMSQDEFDPSAFRDDYSEKLKEVIETKLKGKDVVAPTAEAAPQVINLMDAIKRSLKKPPKPKPASGGRAATKRKTTAASRRKSG